MTKAEALAHWRSLPTGQDPMPHFKAIPYKSSGSSYGACGVRIDGSPEFIDAVLSCLKPLLAAENCHTRLELTYQAVEASPGRPLHKAVAKPHVCYIRRHERGREGQIYQSIINGSSIPDAVLSGYDRESGAAFAADPIAS